MPGRIRGYDQIKDLARQLLLAAVDQLQAGLVCHWGLLSLTVLPVAVLVATAFYVILVFACKTDDDGQCDAGVYDVFSGHGNLPIWLSDQDSKTDMISEEVFLCCADVQSSAP